MDDFALELRGDEINKAIIELLIKNLAHQEVILSVLCEKSVSSSEEADELYDALIEECNKRGMEILRSLYEQRGHVELDDILGDGSE